MSRSYYVTQKKVRAAFRLGDNEPMYGASEKSWVKKKEKLAREATKVVGNKSPSNRAIVAREKLRTAFARSAMEARKQPPTAIAEK